MGPWSRTPRCRRCRRVEQDPADGDPGGAGAGDDDPQLAQRAAGQPGGVLQRRQHHDRGAVLVVVEDGDVQSSRSRSSTSKQRGALMSSRLMPPKEGASRTTVSTSASTSVQSRQIGTASTFANCLNSSGLALHDRHGGRRPDVSEAEHRGAVGDDGDHVGHPGVVVDELRVLGDRAADPGHPRGVGECEVVGVADRDGRADLQLATAMQGEGRVRIKSFERLEGSGGWCESHSDPCWFSQTDSFLRRRPQEACPGLR